jgi:hypothetical protein
MRNVFVSIGLALAACGAEAPPDSPEPSCETLREHLAALHGEAAGVDGDQHARALAAALGELDCAALGAEAVSCALAATDEETARACLTPEGV